MGGDLDRFSAFRLGPKPIAWEWESLSRPDLPGAAFDEFYVRNYGIVELRYTWQLSFFVYPYVRAGWAWIDWIDRPRFDPQGQVRFKTEDIPSAGAGLIMGLPWRSQLSLSYTYSLGLFRNNAGVPGRGGHAALITWSKGFCRTIRQACVMFTSARQALRKLLQALGCQTAWGLDPGFGTIKALLAAEVHNRGPRVSASLEVSMRIRITRFNRCSTLFRVMALSGLVLLTSCASTPPPRETLAQADLAIQEAGRIGAARYQPDLLTSAQQKYQKAVQQMEGDENTSARRLAEEALIEARLASGRSAADTQLKEAAELRKTVDALKKDSTNYNPAPGSAR